MRIVANLVEEQCQCVDFLVCFPVTCLVGKYQFKANNEDVEEHQTMFL